MSLRVRMFFTFFLLVMSLSAQQKQGHVMRPSSKGTGYFTEIGRAQIEVMYALNATDITDERTYIDLHVLRAENNISKHYSRFLELNDSLCDDSNSRLYAQYQALAEQEKHVIFGGRLAEYKYYDMDDTIARAMACWDDNKKIATKP